MSSLPAASHGNVATLALAGQAGPPAAADALEAARQLTADVELDLMAMVAPAPSATTRTSRRLPSTAPILSAAAIPRFW